MHLLLQAVFHGRDVDELGLAGRHAAPGNAAPVGPLEGV